MIHAVAALNIVPMAAPTSGVKPGQSASFTSWPSEAHSAAASLGGRDAVGMAEVALGRPRGVADAQPAGIGAHLVHERPGRRRRPVGVAEVRA